MPVQFFGSATEDQRNIFQQLYNEQASAIISKDLNRLKTFHLDDFKTIGTDGRQHPESDWERDISLDNEANNYAHSVYSLDKLNIEGDEAVVYATRGCAGTNNMNNSFNTEVRIVDRWKNVDGTWKMMQSETVSRKLKLNGIDVTIDEIRPEARHMLQGCGDMQTREL